MERALYGENGFYQRERPANHFRTSVHASARYARAFAALLATVDESLGSPERVDLVDVGAGGTELLVRIMDAAEPKLAARINPVAVELGPPPGALPGRIGWRATLPGEITGLVIANEWLDNVPLDVVEQTPDGPRTVLVSPASGAERTGGAPPEADLDWLERWWPLREPGDRAEVGAPRCAAWAAVIGRLRAGLAIAVDYSHLRHSRPSCGSLAGYRDGHLVPAVPDGSCDITAHVALDACEASGLRAGATASVLTTQRDALRALGLTGERPPLDLARRDPHGYVAALCAAGEDAELTDPAGLGSFGWLAQSVAIPLPPALA